MVPVAAIGHTDDSGKLVSMDLATDGSMAVQPPKDQEGIFGKAPMSINVRAGYSVSLGSDAVSNRSTDADASWLADAEFIRMAVGMTHGLGTSAAVRRDRDTNGPGSRGATLRLDARRRRLPLT